MPGSSEAKSPFFVGNYIEDNREGRLMLPMQLYMDLVSI